MGQRSARRTTSTAPFPAPPPSHLSHLRTPRGFLATAAILVAVALAARLATWGWIFGTNWVELVPSDSHYYVRLARLHLAAGGPVAADPFVGFPLGSASYWPPLHILLVSAAAWIAPDAEAGAAFVGPAATLIWLAAAAWVGYRVTGPGPTLFCLFLLALTPVAVEAGKIGNADHNVHEAPLAALVLLLATAAVRGSARAAVGAGMLAGAARLFTTAGFVLPVVVGVAFAAAAMMRERDDPPLTRQAALAGAACSLVLIAAVLLGGSPGSLDYEGLTLFHPLLACALFGFATAVCATREGRPRAALAGLALGMVGVVLVPQLLRAAGHLLRDDPLLAVVVESTPLATRPLFALALFGPVLIALPFAALGAHRACIEKRSSGVIAALVGTLLFLAGAALQSRFSTFLAGAAAVLLPLGLAALLAGRSPRTSARATGVLVVAFATLLLLLVPPPPPTTPGAAALLRPTLFWMRDNLPPATENPLDPQATPTYGVLAPFDYGHFITLYAERPVLSSPFSQADAHVEANRIAVELLEEADEERAFRRIRELGLAYVLAAPSDLLSDGPPAPDALLSRLLRRDSFAHFRPLFVSDERRAGGGRFATVFEVVEGAVLTGSAEPGARVQAELADGYAREAEADGSGAFRIRVARPGSYVVAGEGASALSLVSEEAVRAGSSVPVGDG